MNRAQHLRNMRNWYRRLFQKGDLIEGAEQPSQAAIHVLAELRHFCRADTSCVVFGRDGQVDTHATAVLEGRREVWLKITQTLNMTDEQLLQIERGIVNYGTRKQHDE